MTDLIHKTRNFPVVLRGSEYWEECRLRGPMLSECKIIEDDLGSAHLTDSPSEIVEIISRNQVADVI
ncbi:MAG TPA: hypothetical protein VLN44_07150, partial [Pyrinomonadaceae bacterium]|nr:hypothetical protein [Pyrinomonadaceae bacterium]